MTRAACIGLTDIFVPSAKHDGRRGPLPPEEAERRDLALAICADCGVLEQCRRWSLYALDVPEHGVVAGMLETERKRARQKLGQPPIPTAASLLKFAIKDGVEAARLLESRLALIDAHGAT